MRTFTRQLRPAIVAVVVFTFILGVAYPLVVTALGQVAFHDNANGSLITVDGEVVGSELLGRKYSGATKF